MTKFNEMLSRIRRAVKIVEQVNEPMKSAVLGKLLEKILLEDQLQKQNLASQNMENKDQFQEEYIG